MRSLISEADWLALAELEPSWTSLTTDQTDAFTDELSRELSDGHGLHGVPFIVVALNGEDDVLIATPTLAHSWGQVHLTWRGEAKPPPWPDTELYSTLAEFIARQRAGL